MTAFMPKIPMTDEEIRMHKPACPDFTDFRAGIRCAERVYKVAELYALNAELVEALRAASNYIDALGGDSKGYRVALEKVEASK